MKHRLLTTAALMIPALAAAQAPNGGAQRMARDIQTLSSDAYEGRAPDSAGEVKTIAYLVAQLKAAGVQPGGDVVAGKRGWTQAVPLLKSEIVGAPTLSLNMATGPMALTQSEQIAVRAPLNGATSVNLVNAPLLFVGYGVTAPERQWDDFKSVDVRGKILVMLINDPDFEGGEGDFGGKAMTYYGRWTYKFEEAARRGAAGVMIVHETAPASYGWNTVKNSNTNTMFDIVRTNPGASHPVMESWIQRDLAERIFAASGTSFEAARAAARRKDFKPIALFPTLNAAYAAKADVITSYNVAGMLSGKRRSDETIIYSAHWDHLGLGQPDANGDRIYNGAVDNATGVAQVLEQARMFAREPRTDRSVAFLLVTAEEKGLLGSSYYAANPLFAVGKTAAVLNTDSMGIAGKARDFSMSGNAKFGLLDLVVAEAARRGRRFSPDAHPEAGHFFRSDHFPFAKAGVPAISFESGSDLVNGGTARGEALAKDYIDKRYHQPDDEFASTWDYSGMSDDAALLHTVGRDLANSAAWPEWSADSEFRAVRDRTAAERGAAAPQPDAGVVRSGERG